MAETLRSLKSIHLSNERSIWIREPAEPTEAPNLAVLLDAELYRDCVGATVILDALEKSRAIANTLVVFVSHGGADARWTECPCHPPFAVFVTEELMPWLEGLHPPVKRARERILIGLSYTGLAAAYVSFAAPGTFTKVIAQSGSFWSNDCWLAAEFRRTWKRITTEYYLDVGIAETAENVQHRPDVLQVVSQIEGVRRFRDALEETGCKVTYREFEGGHDAASWARTLPDALRWALPRA